MTFPCRELEEVARGAKAARLYCVFPVCSVEGSKSRGPGDDTQLPVPCAGMRARPSQPARTGTQQKWLFFGRGGVKRKMGLKDRRQQSRLAVSGVK